MPCGIYVHSLAYNNLSCHGSLVIVHEEHVHKLVVPNLTGAPIGLVDKLVDLSVLQYEYNNNSEH